MLLKRKRSDSENSSCSSFILSSPLRRNAAGTSPVSPSISPFLRESSAQQLPSRTRKRFRDNRPSEAKIHEQTLSMLYSAQKNQQPPHRPLQIPQPPATNNSTQQISLHSFWSLPSRASSCASSDAGNFSPLGVIHRAANCEDCETALVSADGDAMDIDMDIGMPGSALDYACSRCGKMVCHGCAISNLGADRCCLICAGKRTWVGGIGWMDQD